jgi:hypothetical protein
MSTNNGYAIFSGGISSSKIKKNNKRIKTNINTLIKKKKIYKNKLSSSFNRNIINANNTSLFSGKLNKSLNNKQKIIKVKNKIVKVKKKIIKKKIISNNYTLFDGNITKYNQSLNNNINSSYDKLNKSNTINFKTINNNLYTTSKSFNKALSSIKNCVSSNKNTINYIFNIQGGPRGPRGLPCDSGETASNFINRDIVNKSVTAIANCNGYFINQHLTTTSGVTFNTVTVTDAYLLDGVSVTAEQWQHVASLDQSVSTTADVQFNTVNGANISQNTADDLNTINNLGLTGLTTDEVNQLKNIDNTTISSTQWGYLGNLDQNISTTSDVEFNRIDVTSKLNIGPTGSIPEVNLINLELDPDNKNSNIEVSTTNYPNDTASTIDTTTSFLPNGITSKDILDFSVTGSSCTCEFTVNNMENDAIVIGLIEECYDPSVYPTSSVYLYAYTNLQIEIRAGSTDVFRISTYNNNSRKTTYPVGLTGDINQGTTGHKYRLKVSTSSINVDYYDGSTWSNDMISSYYTSNILSYFDRTKRYKIFIGDNNSNASAYNVTINGSYYRPSIPITEGDLTVNGISRIYGDIYLENLLPDKNIVIDSNRQLTTEEKESFIDSSNITWTSTTGRQFTANTVQNISTTADVQFAKITIDDLVISTSYTPSGTADSTGDIGALTWDDDYIYVKTNEGWKKAGLTSI